LENCAIQSQRGTWLPSLDAGQNFRIGAPEFIVEIQQIPGFPGLPGLPGLELCIT